MIEYYEFIDKKADGTKERQLSTTTELYNKLSAEETNRFRSKINEVVDAVNMRSVPLYGVFSLRFKGDGNTDLTTIEVGDIAQRYSSSGIWENAQYNGGGDQDEDNYTVLSSSFEPESFIATATGVDQEFTVSAGAVAKQVYKSRGLLYKSTEWYQVDNVITISVNVTTGNTIYITF